jgi:hypothetical protein
MHDTTEWVLELLHSFVGNLTTSVPRTEAFVSSKHCPWQIQLPMFEKFSIPIWVCFPRNASGIDASPINSSLRHYIPSQGAITHTTKLIQWGQPDNKSQSALGWDNSRLGWGQAGGEPLVSDIPEAHMDSLFPISQPHSGQKQEEDWNAFFAQCCEKNKKKVETEKGCLHLIGLGQ